MNDSLRECGVCLEEYPLNNKSHNFETLLCGHMVCTGCFKNIRTKTNNHVCPFCRQPFYPTPVNSNKILLNIFETGEIYDNVLNYNIDYIHKRDGIRNRKNRTRGYKTYVREELFIMEL